MAFATKEKGRIKMVALMPHGVQNITWYSPDKQNSKSDDFIISGMIKRFSQNSMAKLARCIQFYTNLGASNNQLIAEMK